MTPDTRAMQRPGRGLIIGIGVFALLVIAAIGLVVTHGGGGSGDASATPRVADTAANATIDRSTPLAGTATQRAAATTATTTSVPSATALAFRGPTSTWTDPENRVTVRYPVDWRKDTFDTRDENGTLQSARALVEFISPDSVRLSVIIYNPVDTLENDVETSRRRLTSDPKTPTILTPTQDLLIGGEPAKTFNGSYTQDGTQVSAAARFVTRGGKRIAFSADQIGAQRTEIDTMIGAVTFVAPGAQATVVRTPTAGASRTPSAAATATAAPVSTTAVVPTARPVALMVIVTDTACNRGLTTDDIFKSTQIVAGSFSISIQNTGTAPYTVEFHGNGVNYVSPAIQPGTSLLVSLTFPPGTFTVACNIPRRQTFDFAVS